MAVINTILYETSGNLRIMSAAQITAIKELTAYLYSQNPVETLSWVASNGNLSPTLTDTRYQAGAANLTTDTWASEADTEDISQVTTTYDNVSRTRVAANTVPAEPTENATNTAFPVYWDGATKKIKAMTQTDFFDTFIGPTITDGLVGTGSVQALAAGTYTVLTNSSSISGSPGTTIVSAFPIYADTRADAAAYTADGIAETQDQPTTINQYYLHLITASKPSYQAPVFMRSDGLGVQVYTAATFEALLSDYVQSAAYGKSGYSITYEMGTSVSNQKGTNMNDTYLTGSSASGYTQYRVSASDYRTQEFPNGTAGILNSYKLGITTNVSYTVSADVSSVNEGGTVTFTVTTANVTPGNIAYSITGISSADLSAGSLTGNVTTTGSYSSATGTTSITLDNDTTTEGTETIVFSAGGKSVSVTVNDTSQTIVETVSLEGTGVSPENTGSAGPVTDGSINMGWRFASDGTVRNYDADRIPQYSNGGHVDWINTTPSVTYYIRATIQQDSSSGVATTTNSPSALNTWLALTTNRTFLFEDNANSNSYGPAFMTWKIEIADDAAGSNILDTGYYRNDYEGGA